MTEEALALNRRHGDDCFQEHTVGRLVLARLRWRPQDADAAQLRGFAARYPHLPVWEAMLASLEWELGNVEAARRGVAVCARDDFAAVVALARLPARRAVPGRGDRRRRRAVAGRAALRAARAVRGGEPGARCTCGRSGGPWRAGSGCWPPPTIARATPPTHFADALRLCRRVGRARLGAAHDRRLARDRRPGSGPRRAGRPRADCWRASSALPGVAARIADEAQIITP